MCNTFLHFHEKIIYKSGNKKDEIQYNTYKVLLLFHIFGYRTGTVLCVWLAFLRFFWFGFGFIFGWGTVSSIGSFHFLNIFLVRGIMINDGFWIVLANDTSYTLLNWQRCFPRLVNIFGGKFGKLGHIFANVLAGFVSLFSKSSANWTKIVKIKTILIMNNFYLHWTIHSIILIEKRGGREPHPISCVQGPISIQQKFFKNVHAFFPRHPKISSG